MLDPHIERLIANSPCALWQYNDVIAINSAGRSAGVRKHMLPQQAAELLGPLGGHLVHAFWRKWPGPRVDYRPYNAASVRMFKALNDSLACMSSPSVAVEKASVDECYLDATAACGGCLDRGQELAAKLRNAIKAACGLRVSIGCARNRLLAKLASAAAKKPFVQGQNG